MKPTPIFASLPNELYHLIQEEISDIRTLCALVLVSKHFHATFISYIYRKVDSAALPTLASLDNAALWLEEPHPATYVVDAIFDESGTQKGRGPAETRAIQKQLNSAVRNILVHAPNSALRKFAYFYESFSLPDTFENVDFSKFTSLRDLGIGCLFPRRTLRKSLGMLKSLCPPTLTGLELVLSDLKDTPDATSLAKILLQLAETCPQLKRLELSFPYLIPLDYPLDRVQKVMDDPRFTFPSLRILAFSDFGTGRSLDCTTFFQRHQDLEWLEFNSSTSLNYRRNGELLNSNVLPNLKIFDGDLLDLFLLCSSGSRPILQASLSLWDINPQEEHLLKEALLRTKTLQRLYIHDDRLPYVRGEELPGHNRVTLNAITSGCPTLTELDCCLNPESSKTENLNEVYRTLANNLPSLVHLKITSSLFFEPHLTTIDVSGLKNFTDTIQKAHQEALTSSMSNHKTFKTARVDLHALMDKSYLSGLFLYICDDAREVVPASADLWLGVRYKKGSQSNLPIAPYA